MLLHICLMCKKQLCVNTNVSTTFKGKSVNAVALPTTANTCCINKDLSKKSLKMLQ